MKEEIPVRVEAIGLYLRRAVHPHVTATPLVMPPNQALEPTITAVTSPADAGLAPAVIVAHLER